MKSKTLRTKDIAEILMICGAIHDLAEIVAPDKASHLHIIQHKLERIIATPALRKTLSSSTSKLLEPSAA